MLTEPSAPENCGRAEVTVVSAQSRGSNGVSPIRLTPAPASAERAFTATWVRAQSPLPVCTCPPATRLDATPTVTTPPRMVSTVQPPP